MLQTCQILTVCCLFFFLFFFFCGLNILLWSKKVKAWNCIRFLGILLISCIINYKGSCWSCLKAFRGDTSSHCTRYTHLVSQHSPDYSPLVFLQPFLIFFLIADFPWCYLNFLKKSCVLFALGVVSAGYCPRFTLCTFLSYMVFFLTFSTLLLYFFSATDIQVSHSLPSALGSFAILAVYYSFQLGVPLAFFCLLKALFLSKTTNVSVFHCFLRVFCVTLW